MQRLKDPLLIQHSNKLTFQLPDRRSSLVENKETVKEYSKGLRADPTTDSANFQFQANVPENKLRKSVFTDPFKEDLKYWQKQNPQVVKRIRKLIEDIMRDPFKGIGKPEPLKYQGSNVWSRRIDNEHRIVYQISADQVDFLQARKHY